jgi:hypothetical protein
VTALKKSRLWLVIGAVIAFVGLLSTVVLFFQPWRSCVEDDAAAGCPATSLDAILMLSAMLLGLAGLALVLFSLLYRPSPESR